MTGPIFSLFKKLKSTMLMFKCIRYLLISFKIIWKDDKVRAEGLGIPNKYASFYTWKQINLINNEVQNGIPPKGQSNISKEEDHSLFSLMHLDKSQHVLGKTLENSLNDPGDADAKRPSL